MKTAIAFLLLAGVASTPLLAGNFSFSGTFVTDDQIQLLNFSISGAGPVTIQSWGYGGGVNAAGASIFSGGFDSFFTLYDALGNQIASADERAGGCGVANNPFGNGCLDAFIFEPTLDAGHYTLALTESGNGPAGSLSDGFTQQGNGNFTCGNESPFCDVFNEQLNGHWAVDILTVDSASNPDAPEPSTFATFGLAGLGLFGYIRRRRA